LQWVEGTWDFGNNIIKYANAIQLEADLANYDAGVYHGMTMHVHETGALYYAHAGEWRKLLTDVQHSDVEGAGYANPLGATAYSNDFADLDNAPASILDLGITDGSSGQVLSTDGAGTFSFVDAAAGTGSSFNLIESDDGSFNADDVSNLRILGGENISTEVVTDSDELTINLDSFSINFLTDVDTESNPPATGEVLKWDGAKWAPGIDVAEGGSGLDADTLDGQDGSYYLDYNNFTNTPSVVTLEDLSIGNELTAAGNGAISYDNTTGVFRFTPPTAAGIGALTSVAFSDLTSTPTTIAGYGITDAFSGSFGDLSNTPTTIAGYGITDAFSGDYNDLSNTPAIPSTILDLGISDGTDGQVLTTDGAGNFSFASVTQTSGGDPDQNLFATINADSGSTTADTTTDSLTVAGGTDISTSISGDTVTVSFTGSTSSGASNFDELTDVGSAGIDVNDIFEAAIVTLRVNNNSSIAYTFDSHYSGDNPTIYALSGTTIAFDLDQVGGHPFEIQDSGGTAISQGLVHVSATGSVSTGSSAQGFDSGTLYWRIQESISGNYQYQCQFHAGMNGTITVKRLSAI
jgi:plastocyanin